MEKICYDFLCAIYSALTGFVLLCLSFSSFMVNAGMLLIYFGVLIMCVYPLYFKIVYGRNNFDRYINENKLYNKIGCFLVKRNLIGYEPQQMILILYIQEIKKLLVGLNSYATGTASMGGEGSGEEEPWYKKLARKVYENKGKIAAVAGVTGLIIIFKNEIKDGIMESRIPEPPGPQEPQEPQEPPGPPGPQEPLAQSAPPGGQVIASSRYEMVYVELKPERELAELEKSLNDSKILFVRNERIKLQFMDEHPESYWMWNYENANMPTCDIRISKRESGILEDIMLDVIYDIYQIKRDAYLRGSLEDIRHYLKTDGNEYTFSNAYNYNGKAGD